MAGFSIFHGTCMTTESRTDCRCSFLFLKEGNDEDDEISCTPALAPSRLAQNIPACQPVDLISEEMESKDFVDGVLVDSEVYNTAKSDHKLEEDNPVDAHSGNESEEESRKSVGATAVVDPLLSRSFLNFLYDAECEESQPAEIKVCLKIHSELININNSLYNVLSSK